MPAQTSHCKVTAGAPDRMRAPRAFWASLNKSGLTPGVVLRHRNSANFHHMLLAALTRNKLIREYLSETRPRAPKSLLIGFENTNSFSTRVSHLEAENARRMARG